jgi:hypothetical protein
MRSKNSNDYKIQKRIATAWKDSQSERALRSVDHYHRTIAESEFAGVGASRHMYR